MLLERDVPIPTVLSVESYLSAGSETARRRRARQLLMGPFLHGEPGSRKEARTAETIVAAEPSSATRPIPARSGSTSKPDPGCSVPDAASIHGAPGTPRGHDPDARGEPRPETRHDSTRVRRTSEPVRKLLIGPDARFYDVAGTDLGRMAMAGSETARAKDPRRGDRFESDRTDAEWARLEPRLPAPSSTGRPREVDLRCAKGCMRCCTCG